MKTMSLLGLMGLLLAAMAEAKIGDTKDQCKARYQESDRPNRFDNIFSKKALNTSCTFDDDGKCVRVNYAITFAGGFSAPAKGRDAKFTDAQVKKLLALNDGGSEWEKQSDDPHGTSVDGKYLTKDGSRQALVNFTGVTIELVSYVEKVKAMIKPEAIDAVVNEVVE